MAFEAKSDESNHAATTNRADHRRRVFLLPFPLARFWKVILMTKFALAALVLLCLFCCVSVASARDACAPAACAPAACAPCASCGGERGVSVHHPVRRLLGVERRHETACAARRAGWMPIDPSSK